MIRPLLILFVALGCAASAPHAQTHTPTVFITPSSGPRLTTQLADGTILVAEYGGDRVSAYPATGGGDADRTTFASGAGSGPTSALQLADGTVLVAEYDAGVVAAYPATGGNANRTVFASGLNRPYGLLQLSDGTVLVSEVSNHRVSAYPAGGGNANRTDFAAPLTQPTGMVQLADGSVLVAEFTGGRVSRYPAAGGNANRSDFATGRAQPDGVAQLADGTVLVAERAGNRVSTYPATGGNANRSDFATGIGTPSGVMQLPDGTVIVTRADNNEVLAFGLTRRTFAGGMQLTEGVTQLAGGRILVADYGADVIREYAPDGTRQPDFAAVSSQPTDLVALPNGVVLVSLHASGVVAAFDAGGTRLTDYATGLSGPTGFGTLLDGRVVVAEQSAGRVTIVADAAGGRVTPSLYAQNLSGPFDLVRLADGRMLVTERQASRVSVISDATGAALPVPAPLVQSLSNPTGITQLADGRVVVAEFQGATVTAFAPDGSGRTSFAASLNFPTFITQLTDGRVLAGQAYASGGPGTGQVIEFGGLAAPAPAPVSVGTGEGWAIVAAPGDAETAAGFFAPTWTQCFPGADYTGGACASAGSNVLFYDETEPGTTDAGFEAPTAGAPLAAGVGVLAYLYADDDFDGTPDGFPKTLPLSSAEPSLPFTWGSGGDAPLSFTDDPAVTDDNDGWNLLGNPARARFSWDATWDNGAAGVSAVAHAYDRTANAYTTFDAQNDVRGGVGAAFDAAGALAEGAGFWVQTTAASPSLTAPVGAAARTRAPEPAPHLVVRVSEVGGPRAAGAVLVLSDGATFARDAADGPALVPPAAPYVVAGFVTEADGPAWASAAVPGPAELAAVTEVDLALGAVGLADAEVTWTVALPDGWTAALVDRSATTETPMVEGGRYAVDLSGLGEEPTAGRFAVRLSAGSATQTEGTPAALAVSAVAPNPTASRAALAVTVGAPGEVRAAVYDALGREVAVLWDGPAAGRVALAVEAGALAPGVYVVRVTSPAGAASRTLTVVR